MSDQAVLTRPEGNDISAALQERIRAFTSFYEQHAYLAYNLALRIACAHAPAAEAVQRAFLSQIEENPAGLAASTVEAALRAGSDVPEPQAAGDPRAQSLLAAASALAPAERAALALADLTHAGPDGIGQALGLPVDQAGKLLTRSREAFASKLGLSPLQAEEAARDWMWAAPPNEIWQDLYPRFHRTVERQLRKGAVEHTLVLAPDSPQAPAKASRSVRRGLRPPGRGAALMGRLRRTRWSVVVPLVALLVGLGAAAGLRLLDSPRDDRPPGLQQPVDGSFSDGAAPPAQEPPGVDTPKPRKPLTAALLDKLRLRELRQLRAYGQREADRSLPVRQRRAASRRVAALERAARERLRAERRREAAARERVAREQARSQAPPPPPPDPKPAPRTQRTEPKTETTPSGPPRNRDEAERSCLLDENTGQYICPR